MEYSLLVDVYEQLFATSKRLEKTKAIADFLKEHKPDPIIFLLFRGRIYPDWDDTKIGFAVKMAAKAISLSSGLTMDTIESSWKKKGDLGLVAEEAIEKKKQSTLFSEKLTIKKVYTNLTKLSDQEGSGSVDTKIKLVSELLTSASPQEAKYIIRTVLEDMRVGIGDSTIRDAIATALFDLKDEEGEVKDREEYNHTIESLQEAYDIANDWSIVFEKAQNGLEALNEIEIQLGKPLKCMLFPKAISVEDAFETVGKPCAFEYKYDGFRMQIHKKDQTVSVFTRRLENVTNQFPEVKELILKNINAETCILDAEAVGIDKKTGHYKPFQEISQRIKRKHNIHELVDKLPIEINIFDILLYNNEPQLKTPFQERRKIMENITTQEEKKIILAQQIITDDVEQATNYFEKAVELGNEGLMAKKLDGIYKPGSRVGYGVKIKAMKESVDLVIVGAEYGEGKRAGWLSSFTIACLDEDGSILEIGKVSTGLKEKDEEGTSFNQLTNLLKPLILSEEGKLVTVKPQIIIEVGYEELQKSPTYSSGFALRFPRFLTLREDKSLDEITTIDYIDKLYKEQK